MSKLVNLSNEIYIPVNTITKVTGPHEDQYNVWYCVVAYKDGDVINYHKIFFNKKFVTTEEKAIEHSKRLIERFNKHL
jgi:hypothetical protein